MNDITSKTYDGHIKAQGLEFQVGTYYEPKEPVDKRRIKVVLDCLDPQPGEKILDIGCGVGTFAFHGARLGADSFGIDYSQESIRAATHLTQRYDLKGKAHFVVGNGIYLPFADSAFDKIVCADFIEHITFEEKDKLLQEMKRVLKKTGKIIIFTPNKIREDLGKVYWQMRHFLFGHKIHKAELHYGLITRGAFEGLLNRYGLSFKFYYSDLTRPYLPRIPFLNKFLSLNLLWHIYPSSKEKTL